VIQGASVASALLDMFITEALEAGSRIVVWPRVKAKVKESQLTSDALEEAFTALKQRRYLKVKGHRGRPARRRDLGGRGPARSRLRCSRCGGRTPEDHRRARERSSSQRHARRGTRRVDRQDVPVRLGFLRQFGR
jgi:hypothetical protein